MVSVVMGSGASSVEAARPEGPQPDLGGSQQRQPEAREAEDKEPDHRGPEHTELEHRVPEPRALEHGEPEQRQPDRREPEETESEQGELDHPQPAETQSPQREVDRKEPDQEATPSTGGQLDNNHTVDVLSLRTENDDDEEQRCPPTEAAAEGGEVSLDIESFLHDSGTLYSCFLHHGRRVYVDERQKLQPFPKAWYREGRFLDVRSEDSRTPQTPPTNQPAVTEDERASSIYIHGRGSVMTYMFEERRNVCRFWDPQSGVWLLLPLHWEKDVDFVFHRIQCVMSALPGLQDPTEITAALRQCNYDPEEVVSSYLTLFGHVLLQPAARCEYEDPPYLRLQQERERLVEELQRNLEQKQTEAEQLVLKNQQLLAEVRYLGDTLQHLNHKTVELETERQEAREKVRALLRSRATPPPPPAKAGPDAEQVRRLRRLARHLSVGARHLRSSVERELGGLGQQLEQLRAAVGGAAQAQREALQEAQQLRGLYRKETLHRRSLHNKLLELQGNIRVFCRCRGSPASDSDSCLEQTHDQEVLLISKESRKKFHFDKVFPPTSAQEDVFEGILPLITSCVDGYNVCILAYGQTGSGKTFTMMGSRENPGVNIRSIRELLRVCAEKEEVSYTLKVSMLEIYLDTLKDLLADGGGGTAALELRVQGKSVSVPGLSWVQVQTEEDIRRVMETGEKNRKMASTKMNIHSSRSHLLVALEVCSSDQVSGLKTRSTLTLCDLAGSERISKTEAEGQRLVEAAAINKSLTALAQVFGALRSNALHVPFRNSKLTHLLQPSLSGDAKCCVFVNVSPEAKDTAETLSTLQFGSSIRQVTLGKAPRQVAHAGGRRPAAGRGFQRDL